MEWFRSKVDHQIELEWKGTSRMELHESKWNIMEWFRSTWNSMDIIDQFGKEENGGRLNIPCQCVPYATMHCFAWAGLKYSHQLNVDFNNLNDLNSVYAKL